jgi:chromosome segregation ATPase
MDNLETERTLNGVSKLLALIDNLISNPKKKELDEKIASYASVHEEQLDKVESLETEINSIQEEINRLQSKKATLSKERALFTEKLEETEYVLNEARKEHSKLLEDFKSLKEYEHELNQVGLLIAQVQLLIDKDYYAK